MSTQPDAAPAALATFASTVGGQVSEDDYGLSVTWGAAPNPALPDGLALLPDWGVIEVSGPDADRFLHSQLTQDVLTLAAGQARWAGYCSPKGRLLGTFRLWRSATGVFLATARPVVPTLVQGLRRYVLRAKVQIVDASEQYAVMGLLGAALLARVAAARGLTAPGPEEACAGEHEHLVGLPTCAALDQGPRTLWLVPPATLTAQWAALCHAAFPMATAAWRRTEVLCGVPRIVPTTAEQFVPQMLNFESVGGVNFTKGCYPGQEVVARSQYLGKLKRRMFLAQGIGSLPAPGSDITSPAHTEPCGRVVLAAPSDGSGFVALFEAPSTTVAEGALRAGASELVLLPLPYALQALE